MSEPLVHLAPEGDSQTMPCCGLPPGERMADRMTTDPGQVTCGRWPIGVHLIPPGQLLVATIPDNWDEASVEQAADTLDRARAALGMPDGACVVLTGGIELQTLTDEQLAQAGLLRHVSQVNEDRIKAAAVQLHRNRYRIEQGASEPTPDEGGQLSVMWSNVAREVLRAYLGIDPL